MVGALKLFGRISNLRQLRTAFNLILFHYNFDNHSLLLLSMFHIKIFLFQHTFKNAEYFSIKRLFVHPYHDYVSNINKKCSSIELPNSPPTRLKTYFDENTNLYLDCAFQENCSHNTLNESVAKGIMHEIISHLRNLYYNFFKQYMFGSQINGEAFIFILSVKIIVSKLCKCQARLTASLRCLNIVE